MHKTFLPRPRSRPRLLSQDQDQKTCVFVLEAPRDQDLGLEDYSVSQKNPPPLGLSDFFHFFHKRLRIFNRFFIHPLYVLMYARLQIFM